MVEQPSDLSFGIVHDRLVVHAQHPSGKRYIPVAHQGQIVPVVGAQHLEGIAERLAAREVLLEQGTAAVQRVAACIDEQRARQHHVNKSHVEEVVRHLVQEARRTAPVGVGFAQIALTQGVQFGGPHVGQNLRIAAAGVQFPRVVLDLGQFHRALHGAVAGQDLLDERRA